MKDDITLEANLHVIENNGKKGLEIRRCVFEKDLIKDIILCADSGKPLVVYPKFTDRLKARGRLVELGILTYDFEKNVFHFNI